MNEIRGNKIIFKALVGSHSYGTNIEGSDMDYKGVFIQRPEDVLEFGYTEQIDVSKDEVYYELGRFLSLCGTGNPTMLELLFTPPECVIYEDRAWDLVKRFRNSFVTKVCRLSFGGYAISQIKKAGGLDKKMNWEKERVERKTVEDFCYVLNLNMGKHYQSKADTLASFLKEEGYETKDCGLVKVEHIRDCYLLFCDDLSWLKTTGDRFKGEVRTHNFKGIAQEGANDVCLSDVPNYVNPRGILYFNKDAYSIHCREYNSYESWLRHRNTQRYVDIEGHGQQIDGKNLLHCVRLIETAIEIARTGLINVKRPNAEYLISIRKGKLDLKTILEKCEKDLEEMDLEFDKSDLPEKISEEIVKDLIKEVRQDYYNNETKTETSNP